MGLDTGTSLDFEQPIFVWLFFGSSGKKKTEREKVGQVETDVVVSLVSNKRKGGCATGKQACFSSGNWDVWRRCGWIRMRDGSEVQMVR